MMTEFVFWGELSL